MAKLAAELVMAFSGGGSRGLISAELVQRLDESVGVVERTGLFVGTSIGAAIAAGLAAGFPPFVVADVLRSNIESTFRRSPVDPLHVVARPRYDSDPLREALEFLFADMRLGELWRPVAIVAFDLSAMKIKVFDHEDADVPVVDAIMASAAAPIYFSDYCIDGAWFTDGGWVANNPCQVAHVQVMRHFADSAESFRLLSIGTGQFPAPPQRTNNLISTGRALPVLTTYDTHTYAYDWILRERFYALNPQMHKWLPIDCTDVEALRSVVQDADIQPTVAWLRKHDRQGAQTPREEVANGR